MAPAKDKLSETMLTPALAATLLANPHPKQRRAAPQTVALYARAIREGRWRLLRDAILVAAKPDGRMFNGAHRCSAVISAQTAIPVYIDWHADPETFDLIDVGRRRSAYQFISETEATARASAARVTLWYERRFDRPLLPRFLGWDLHEILNEAERRAPAFADMSPWARMTYENTSLPMSVVLAAYAIASDMGFQEAVEAFARGVADPLGLAKGDPARLLSERFRKQSHRGRRRQMTEDWTILLRALNAHLEGRSVSKLQLASVWPRVGEKEPAYQNRLHAASGRRGRADHVAEQHAKVVA